MQRAIFLSLNALGDTLCITPALHAFRRDNPETSITAIVQAAPFTRVLDGNPDIDLLIYSERLYLEGIPEERNAWIQTLPLGLRETANLYHMNLSAVVTSNDAFRQHISEALASILPVTLDSVRPVVALNAQERRAARLLCPFPYVVLNWHSVSNPQRSDGDGRHKDWPMERWGKLIERIALETTLEVCVLGAERDPLPQLPGVRPLHGLPIKVVAALLERAACVVTLENGIAHLAAGVDASMVVIYSNLMPREWAFPRESSNCEVLYDDPRNISLDQVWTAINDILISKRSLASE
jgi:ADP-heptose:LPS heptosyltransferase